MLGAAAGAAGSFGNTLSGWGTLLGGLGSIYGGYQQGKMAKDMFSLQKENLMYNRNEEEKRLKGLGGLGSSYGTSSTLGSL